MNTRTHTPHTHPCRIYGQLEGTRVVTRTSDSKLGVWGALTATNEIRIAVWNRSTQPLVATLSLPGVPDSWGCTMYRVDDTTFQVSAALPYIMDESNSGCQACLVLPCVP